MILFDEDARIIDCTNDIQNKLGFTKKKCYAYFCRCCLSESYTDIVASLGEIKKQGSIQIKSIHKKKDGSSIFVNEHITYLKDRNVFICMVKQESM
jgi:hypothetical protein